MFDLFLQILGLAALLAGIYIGYRRWIMPRIEILSMQGRGLLLLLILTMMGGFIGSVGWWVDDPRTFSWDIPPLAGRMLASAGWAFGVSCLMALNRPTYKRVRLILWMLFVYLVPLAGAIILFHLDYFDPRAPIVYAFFILVITMVVAASWYLNRQPEILPQDDQADSSSSGLVRSWFTLIVLITGFWGTALFITDSGPIKSIWVWAGDLLSSRLIGAMLLTIAAGAWYSRDSADAARVMGAAIFTYAVGLALASVWGALFGLPVAVSYLTVFGVIGVISGLLLISDKAHLTA